MEATHGLRPHLSPSPPGGPRIEFHGSANHGRAALLLPGYGDTSAVFARRLHLIDPEGLWALAIAEPVSTGPDGPMWYLVDDDGPDPAGLTSAVDAIAIALDAVASHTALARGDIVLVGYSQGGAAALATMLDPTSGPPPRAAAILAGYLTHRDDPHLDLTRAAGRPVLVAHGADDRMVDTIRGRSAARVLHRNGASVTWAESGGGHRLGTHLLAPLAAWLAELVDDQFPTPSPP